MALKYNESTGEVEERDEPRKPELSKKNTKDEGGCLSSLLGLVGGTIWLALPYLILLGLASLCS